MLTNRRIRIEPERREEVDLHYLGRALLRLAHEQYDGQHASVNAGQPPEAVWVPARPHEARTGLSGQPRGARPVASHTGPRGRREGATG